jgi:hypothetical protein
MNRDKDQMRVARGKRAANMKRSFRLARILLIVVGALAAISRAGADESEIFHKPVRLQAEGRDIDTGENWGHSGPCAADVDGDGLRDLVVGDFRGKFRFYKNVGSDKQPKYAAFTLLQAGDEDAKVPIYCCIGSSPFFVDFDNDGKLDFISTIRANAICFVVWATASLPSARRCSIRAASRSCDFRIKGKRSNRSAVGR